MIQHDRIYWVRKGVGGMAFNASDWSISLKLCGEGVNSKTHLERDTIVNFVDWSWSDSIA